MRIYEYFKVYLNLAALLLASQYIYISFKEHINFSWCLYEDCTRNVDGLAAVKGSGGSINGFRKRFWFCKICKDYDTEVLQKVKSTGLGLCCLRDFESKKLLEHQNSSKHIECRQGLEEFRKSVNNAPTSPQNRVIIS